MKTLVNIASSYGRYLLGLVTVAFLTPYIIGLVGVESQRLEHKAHHLDRNLVVIHHQRPRADLLQQ